MHTSTTDAIESTPVLPAPVVLAAELWTPAPDKDGGVVCDATLPNLEATPTPCFASGQAMAETAIATTLPAIVTDAQLGGAGVKAAVVLPQFDLDGKPSVLILYLRGGADVTAAAELWRGRPGSFELSMGDGYHPGLERFARVSQYVCFPRGAGLPGAIWESGLPKIIGDVGSAKAFLRSSRAGDSGLTTGLGLPVVERSELKAVLLLLSSKSSPVIHRQSIWQAAAPEEPVEASEPQSVATTLVCVEAAASEAARKGQHVEGDTCTDSDDSLAARAWASGRVEMGTLADDPAGLECGLAIPVVLNGRVRGVSVLNW